MPSPAKTSKPDILAAARTLVHEAGVEALSMQDVAVAVGVRAPSLYKHYADRAALLGALRGVVAIEMRDAIAAVSTHRDPARALLAIARAHRAYALAAPHLYSLVMTTAPGADLDPEVNVAMVAPLLECVRRLCPRRTGDAARFLSAYVHGFVTMETAGAFRLGGDLDASFEFGLAHLVRSLSPA